LKDEQTRQLTAPKARHGLGALHSAQVWHESACMVAEEKQERFAMTNAFPWDNPGKDDLEELQAALKKAGKEVTLQELQEMQRKVIRETAGLPNDEEIEYSSNPQEGA
jgi:MFS superfamily sulfate permease-like transporter